MRQLYLLAAIADLAAETGEQELRDVGERLWSAMAATKTHLTGGVGAHHDKEEFGDPYELPTERAYCETCAAIASIQWSWRMALLTGQARYSDLVERTLFNGFLSGVSLDGESWLYINPLQVRDGHDDQGGDKSARRTAWFRCACCPPNVMRLLASLEHYFSSTDGHGIQLHQFADGTYGGEASSAPVIVSVNTDYPWDGRITVTVDEAPSDVPWTLSLRIPQWCKLTSPSSTTERIDDEASAPVKDGWLRLTRTWKAGERVVLELDMEPRLTSADPRADAVRGCVAIERGPLVYCLEQVDHPGGGLDDVVIETARARSSPSTVRISSAGSPRSTAAATAGVSRRRAGGPTPRDRAPTRRPPLRRRTAGSIWSPFRITPGRTGRTVRCASGCPGRLGLQAPTARSRDVAASRPIWKSTPSQYPHDPFTPQEKQ